MGPHRRRPIGAAPRQPREDGTVRVTMFEFKQNDPRMDTGMRLVKRGHATSMTPAQKFGGVVLSGEATRVLSGGDRELVQLQGVAAINCSWNRLDELKPVGRRQCHRLLPLLIAANTINYGRAAKLCSAEALGAALVLTGFREQAEKMLSIFAWGSEFFRINGELFELYDGCYTEADIRAAEAEYQRRCGEAQAERRAARDLMIQGGTNDDSDGEEGGDRPTEEASFEEVAESAAAGDVDDASPTAKPGVLTGSNGNEAVDAAAATTSLLPLDQLVRDLADDDGGAA